MFGVFWGVLGVFLGGFWWDFGWELHSWESDPGALRACESLIQVRFGANLGFLGVLGFRVWDLGNFWGFLEALDGILVGFLGFFGGFWLGVLGVWGGVLEFWGLGF
uniref:Uncharacterized protein n=1 Tax=Zonotrichia albicollis TaxID=44394 RepID=A0A8D2M138_ZONAL